MLMDFQKISRDLWGFSEEKTDEENFRAIHKRHVGLRVFALVENFHMDHEEFISDFHLTFKHFPTHRELQEPCSST